MRTLKNAFNDAESEPAAPASLETLEDVQLERAVEEVRLGRVETERAEEAVKEYGFRRIVLIVVLGILALVALGALAVVAAAIVAGQYPLAAGAVAPLSGSGAMSVVAWRTYIGNAPYSAIDDARHASSGAVPSASARRATDHGRFSRPW